jgi:hypothetical protein
MILGMSTATFTALHVVLSLFGIGSGLIVVFGLMGNRQLPAWTAVFLTTTAATSVTGFLFHSKSLGAPHVVGFISLVVLAVAVGALYRMKLAGVWRAIYVISAVLALYLNVFVGVVQAFQKISALHALAPTGSEPPFAAVQLMALVVFVGLAVLGVKRFRPLNPS